MSEFNTVNAEITHTRLGIEGHGIFTFFITLKLENGNIGFGNFALDERKINEEKRTGTEFGMNTIMRLLEVVGVGSWEELKGKYIRVNEIKLGEEVVWIGNLINDDWFNVKYPLSNFDKERK